MASSVSWFHSRTMLADSKARSSNCSTRSALCFVSRMVKSPAVRGRIKNNIAPGARSARPGDAGPVRALLGGENAPAVFVSSTNFCSTRCGERWVSDWSFLHLPGIFEPLLVVGRLLPPLVGRAGADQVHVGPEVFAARAGPVAGAVPL